jgi:hypothetical protein
MSTKHLKGEIYMAVDDQGTYYIKTARMNEDQVWGSLSAMYETSETKLRSNGWRVGKFKIEEIND